MLLLARPGAGAAPLTAQARLAVDNPLTGRHVPATWIGPPAAVLQFVTYLGQIIEETPPIPVETYANSVSPDVTFAVICANAPPPPGPAPLAPPQASQFTDPVQFIVTRVVPVVVSVKLY